MLKYNITKMRFYMLESSWKHTKTPALMLNTIKKSKAVWWKCYILKLIIKAVNLCSKQSFPLCGCRHNSSDLFSRVGSFLKVVKTIANVDLILKDHPETGSKNAQMISWKIQNEIISYISKLVRTKIRSI